MSILALGLTIVLGAKGASKMPGAIPCGLVAGALIAAAWWPHLPASALRTLGLAVLLLVFLGRGAVAYAGFWRALTPEQLFAMLDRRYYGPLCFALGAGFTFLFIEAVM